MASAASPTDDTDPVLGRRPLALIPGIAVSIVVAITAVTVGAGETRMFGRAIVEPLVLAILIGMALRGIRGEPAREAPGVRFVAKEVLEVAVCLLGATMNVPRLLASGPMLAIGIVGLVIVALGVSYAIGRAAGLTPKLAILVACGNSICGNSAIAAVAPVIGAKREDVAASIALTAVLGVVVVVGLPFLIVPLGLSHYQYGVLAGLTVYAVPQVLAAAFAVSVLSGQVATVVKLARVLMLGPVVVFFSLRHRDRSGREVGASRAAVVPWFVGGFVLLAMLRSFGAVPEPIVARVSVLAGWLTIAAMAALGLSVELHAVRRVGVRVVSAVAGSLGALIVLAVLLIRILPAH